MDKKIYLRKVEPGDCDLIYRWSNDDVVRKNSFHVEPIVYESHIVWFKNQLEKNVHFYILRDEDEDVGQIRGDRDGDRIVVTYDIDVHKRGNGYGTEIVRLFEKNIEQGIALVAYVKQTNYFSQKVFMKLGYCVEDCKRGFVKFVKWL